MLQETATFNIRTYMLKAPNNRIYVYVCAWVYPHAYAHTYT